MILKNNGINNEDVLIRHEKVGPIIWSKDQGRYFFSEDLDVQNSINIVLLGLKEGKSLDELTINLKFKEELKKLGFAGKIREIIPNSEKLLSTPLEIYFDYTYECNLRCSYCYNKEYLGNKVMKEEDVSKIFSEMYKLGIMRVHLAGGEPMSNESGFKNYLEEARKYGILLSMATNGTLLSDNNVKTIIDNNIFSVTFSLDGGKAESNDALRGKGSFNKTIEGINKLIIARDKAGIDMEIDIKPVFSIETNNNDLEMLVKLAIDLGIDKIKFYNPERSLSHEIGYYGKGKDEYYKKLEFLKELQNKYKSKIKIPIASNPNVSECMVGIPRLKGCVGAQELLTINPDGKITPCLMDNYELGNIHRNNGLENFLKYSEELKNYLDKIISPKCDGCDIYSTCRGGCQVRKIVEYGDLIGVDPLCPVDKEIVKFKKYDALILKPVDVIHSL